MPLEWLLVGLFVLLPLIERLLKAARRRMDQGAPARPEAARSPSAPTAIRPPQRAGQPAPTHARAERPAVPERRPPARRPRVASDLRQPAGLRRAVVLMTILGPCRALDPDRRPGGPVNR